MNTKIPVSILKLNLTKQEYRILELLNEGASAKAVAKKLEISQHTVCGHMKSIYLKLNVRSRSEAQCKINKALMGSAQQELFVQAQEKATLTAELAFANHERARLTAELAFALINLE